MKTQWSVSRCPVPGWCQGCLDCFLSETENANIKQSLAVKSAGTTVVVLMLYRTVFCSLGFCSTLIGCRQ